MRSRLSLSAPTRVLGLCTAAFAVVLMVGTAVSAQTQPTRDRTLERELPARIADLRLETPEATSAATVDFLKPGVGAQDGGRVIVRLSAESGSTAWVRGRDEADAKKAVRAQQEAFIVRVKSIDSDARVLGRVQLVLNAVFVEVDASKLDELARDPAVVRIAPVAHYEADLSETVPYIGAAAVQAKKITGKGIKVAVLDSGIDYTHKALGGSGDPADYTGNDPDIIEPGTFPTKKVVGGYDFVGSEWFPDGPDETPDPDPLDDGPGLGTDHGTHVASIIGGEGGVAPGVDLYGVKVCSTVTTSCSGIALIQGMEFAADPNFDGKVRDRVDIINMSLGSDYGQPFDDDLSQAVDNATALGILTVAGAGNGSDKPYSAGTPANAPTALSVAQTQVPSATLQTFVVNGSSNYPAVFQPWSTPLASTISAPVQYGDGNGGALDGCSVGPDPNSTDAGTEPFKPGSLTGKIVLVDRGTCGFSVKIFNVQRGGGLVGVIGLIAPGAPFAGGFSAGGPFTIPGFMISEADSGAIKAAIAGGGATGTLNPANTIPLAGQMVGSSARGPQQESTQLIKPEIGAPGASVSALAGTGFEEGPFGGTSGASPMVAGSAALLLDRFGGSKRPLVGRPLLAALIPGLSPTETKARLMNNAETDIKTDPFTGLAPITRIGGGEVRVDRAIDARVVAWDKDVPTGALGFGFVDVADATVTLEKTLVLRNYDKLKNHTYSVTPTFRFQDDVTNGAVSVSAPSTVKVRAGLFGDTKIDVKLTIEGAKLRGNFMNSGSVGADPSGLTLNEYDGYLVLTKGSHQINIPWHVLPRKAAKVTPSTTTIVPGSFPQAIGLDNQGVGTAQNDAYALLATSDNIPEGGQGAQSPTPDIRAVGINTFPVDAGFCSGEESFLWVFAISTHERQEHLVPVSHQVYLDIDRDGTDDYAVINRDVSLDNVTDGRQLTWSVNLGTGVADAFFFAEHSTNTGNTALIVCAEQVGLTGEDLWSTNVDMDVVAQDFYYGGPGDLVEGLTVTPYGERFYGGGPNGSPFPDDIPGKTNAADALAIYDFGPFPGNTDELGLMLFTSGDRGAGNRGSATKLTESLLFTTP